MGTERLEYFYTHYEFMSFFVCLFSFSHWRKAGRNNGRWWVAGTSLVYSKLLDGEVKRCLSGGTNKDII